MAMSRNDFLDMMANKAERSRSAREISDIINRCDPEHFVSIAPAPGGHGYIWKNDGELETYEIDLGDGDFVEETVPFADIDDVRYSAGTHIRQMKD